MMELRVLKYFLTVAQEGSITRAAEILHVTQPTLSRQLINLEEELGTALFKRDRQQTLLTDSGILFEQRAREIVSLADKTEREFIAQKVQTGGVVSIGCVESTSMRLLPGLLKDFSQIYPLVQYDLYSGSWDDIREKIDRGLIDIGFLTEPAEIAKYESFSLLQREEWGLLMRADDPLAQMAAVHMEELAKLPLIIPKRGLLQREIASWSGQLEFEQLHILSTYNILFSAILLVKQGIGYGVCLRGAGDIHNDGSIRFVPFSPKKTAGNILIWKRNRGFNPATALLVDFIKTQTKLIP